MQRKNVKCKCGISYRKALDRFIAEPLGLRGCYIGIYKTKEEAERALGAYMKTAEYKRAIRKKEYRKSQPKKKYDYKKFINEKLSYELDKPLSAGRGGKHYAKTSSMGMIAQSGIKRTRTKKQEHKPYKPTAQMHSLYSLKDIRNHGILGD